MVVREGDSIKVSGSLTIDTVTAMVQEIAPLLVGGANQVDLSGVSEVDSSAVALLLEWQRQAGARGARLNWSALPDAIHNLAALYGVQDLIAGAE